MRFLVAVRSGGGGGIIFLLIFIKQSKNSEYFFYENLFPIINSYGSKLSLIKTVT
jgi:hypothetical protein